MAASLPRLLSPALCIALALASGARAAEDDVTIYRCTDAKGHLTLRDTPCTKGQQQETRTMLRPKDAPMRLPARAPERAYVPEREPPHVVVMNPPRPLYECVTPDGDLYTSETPEGHPRWVPLWTLGYPYTPGMIGNAGLAVTRGLSIQSGRTVLLQPPSGLEYGAGTWIQDVCHALPPEEVCARLVDRRDEIRRRFFNAMPSERDVLRVEERGINARLNTDCGDY